MLALVVVVGAACTDDNGGDGAAEGVEDARVVQLGAPGESTRELTDEEAAAITTPQYTRSDVIFMQGMIAHHQQALEMTAMVDDHTDSEDIALLAERMEVSQVDEIDQMFRWLDERGEALDRRDDYVAHTGLMPGMLTDEQMAAIDGASDDAFDELFLQGMIQHHEGAIAMVQELMSGGERGQELVVFRMADDMAADQAVEIARMKQMLADRAAGS